MYSTRSADPLERLLCYKVVVDILIYFYVAAKLNTKIDLFKPKYYPLHTFSLFRILIMVLFMFYKQFDSSGFICLSISFVPSAENCKKFFIKSEKYYESIKQI